VSFSETVRAMMSVPLPGVKGTTILTGFVGQVCACAPACTAHSASAAIDLPSFPDILSSRAGCRAVQNRASSFSYSLCGPIQNQIITLSFMTPSARQSRSIRTE
jgi:hypothetical protein